MNETMLTFNFSEMYFLTSSWLQYSPVESVRTKVSFPTVSAFHVIVWPQQFPVSWFPYPFLPYNVRPWYCCCPAKALPTAVSS